MQKLIIGATLMLAGCASEPNWQRAGTSGTESLEAAKTICEAEKQKAYMTSREGLTVFTFGRLDTVHKGCMAEHGYVSR